MYMVAATPVGFESLRESAAGCSMDYIGILSGGKQGKEARHRCQSGWEACERDCDYHAP